MWMRMTIGKKLLWAYFFGATLMVLTSGYAIHRLYDLTQRADYIIKNDFEMLENIGNLLTALLKMEEAAKKYPVLKDPEIAEFYWMNSREIELYLRKIAALRGVERREFATASAKKAAYDELFMAVSQLVLEKRDLEAREVFTKQGDPILNELVTMVKSWDRRCNQEVDRGMKDINKRSLRAMQVTVILSIIGLVAGLTLAIFIILDISRPLKKLERATGQIAAGKFETQVEIKRDDEIGHLARAFNFMARRLKELEALHLDASPLTRLPGNLAIEREIDRRLKEGQLFSLCHIDLDNFKPFADTYGYAWGSEIIKETAALLEEAKKSAGAESDFIGHIGGDDFILVADPQRALKICAYIVQGFEERMRRFYPAEDVEKGYIVARDRKGQRQKFPLVTVTISIVTDDGTNYRNPVEMARAVARVKEYGKTLPGSTYVTKEEMEKCSYGDLA